MILLFLRFLRDVLREMKDAGKAGLTIAEQIPKRRKLFGHERIIAANAQV